jgi:hypothetical protein
MGGSIRYEDTENWSAGSQQGDSRSGRKVSEENRERRVTYTSLHVAGRQWYASQQTRASRIWRDTTTIAWTTPPLLYCLRNRGRLIAQGEMNTRARPRGSTKRSGHDSKLILQPCVPCWLGIAPPNPSPAALRIHTRGTLLNSLIHMQTVPAVQKHAKLFM